MAEPALRLSDKPDSEEECIELYSGLVDYFAFRAKTTNLRDIDDIRQDGFMGLIQAYRTWDPAKGASFKTWATYMVRFWVNHIGARNADLNEHNAWLRDRDAYNEFKKIISLDQALEQLQDHSPYFRDESAEAAFDLDSGPGFDDLLAPVKDVRLRFVLVERFVKSRKYDDIGMELGVSKQRVEQLVKKALDKIKKRFGGRA